MQVCVHSVSAGLDKKLVMVRSSGAQDGLSLRFVAKQDKTVVP